jgi:hypothetical protein
MPMPMAADTDPAFDDDAFARGGEDDAFDPADGHAVGGDNGQGQPAAAGDVAERLSVLVAFLARNLVDDPDAVEVDAQQRGGSVFVTLRVPEAELGKVIGRQGRIARAMRTALSIAGSRQHVRASLDIEG